MLSARMLTAKSPATAGAEKSADKPRPVATAPEHEPNPLWSRLATFAGAGATLASGTAAPPPPKPNPVWHRLATTVQPKLTVGAPDDEYEREADSMADRVIRMPEPVTAHGSSPPSIQRMCSECEEEVHRQPLEEEEEIQMKPAGVGQLQRKSDQGTHRLASRQVHRFIASPGAGAPLPDSVRNRVEPVLGADLSGIRVHSDQRAQGAAVAIQAKAFTNKNNIYLGAGQRSADVRLMAHEATHTLQQGAVSSPSFVLQRDATNQSISPGYAAALDDSELTYEIQAIEEFVGNESNEYDEALRSNLQILREEYFFREPSIDPRTIQQFQESSTDCYDRETQPYTMVVDAHVHFEPFGGDSVPTPELYDWFSRAGVLFASAYGIGQVLPWWSDCTYYKNCPGVPVTPSLKNDLINVRNLAKHKPGTPTILSRTFPDLKEPQDVLWKVQVLDVVYPDMFTGMGEVNLVKQALFPNLHEATPLASIPEWDPFMEFLRERDMPIAIHSDLGRDPESSPLDPANFGAASWLDSSITQDPRKADLSSYYQVDDECPSCHDIYVGSESRLAFDSAGPFTWGLDSDTIKREQTKYLHLMEAVLKQYPDNKIVWMHMGLSEELTSIDPQFHIALMEKLLGKYPKLMLDISWRVLWDNYFQHEEKREYYVPFLNKYSDRVIVGTDFVADIEKNYSDYEEVVDVNSRILQYLDDDAFRNIALGENYFRLYSLPYSAPDVCADVPDLSEWIEKMIRTISWR